MGVVAWVAVALGAIAGTAAADPPAGRAGVERPENHAIVVPFGTALRVGAQSDVHYVTSGETRRVQIDQLDDHGSWLKLETVNLADGTPRALRLGPPPPRTR